MPWTFVAFELSVYLFGLVLFRHAVREGRYWYSLLPSAMVFGLVLELIMVRYGLYEYGRFMLMVGAERQAVPLWIGIGWGEVVYASAWTASRLPLPAWARPLSAASFAVNLDLSLDPVAEMLGFWHWIDAPNPNFYGVPFDNFLGWFLIVSGFMGGVSGVARLLRAHDLSTDRWAAPIGASLACVVIVAIQLLAPTVYAKVGQVGPFLVVFVLANGASIVGILRARRDHPISWPIVSHLLYFHTLLLVLFLATGGLATPHLASIAVLVPFNLATGIVVHVVLSMDHLAAKARRWDEGGATLSRTV